MSSNPYQAPSADSLDCSPLFSPAGEQETARAVFLGWERLRLVYNGVLAVLTLLLAGAAVAEFEFWEYVVLGVLVANSCFCLGPVVEGYASLFGVPRKIARWLIFIPGLGLACLLTVGAVFSWHFRDFGN